MCFLITKHWNNLYNQQKTVQRLYLLKIIFYSENKIENMNLYVLTRRYVYVYKHLHIIFPILSEKRKLTECGCYDTIFIIWFVECTYQYKWLR